MSNARDHLFKIPFKQYSIPDWEHHKKLILDALPKDDYTDFFALKGKGLPSYISTVGDAIDPCMKDFSQTYPPGVFLSSMWYERSRKFDAHGPHNHGATGFSAILYVDFDQSEHESTVFYSPFNDPMNGDDMSFQPVVREGDLIIFPAMILHEGPMNMSEKERVIVSFNIMGEDVLTAYNSGKREGVLSQAK